MFVMILGLIWLVIGAALYLSSRKPDNDTRFDRSTPAEAAGLALLWPLVICIMLLYDIVRKVQRLFGNTSY